MNFYKHCLFGDLENVRLAMPRAASSIAYGIRNAIENGHLNVVKFLLEYFLTHHYNSIKDLSNLLFTAYQFKQYHIMEYLNDLSNNIPQFRHPQLFVCYFFGDDNLLEYAIKHGVQIDSHTLKYACEDDRLDLLKYLVSLGADIVENDIPLITACKKSNIPIVKYLIQNGANYRSRNDIMIDTALQNGNVSIGCYLSLFYSNFVDIHHHNNFQCFYTLTTTFYNTEKWNKMPDIKENYLFDSNLSLIVASFLW